MKKFIVLSFAALTFLMCCGFRYDQKSVCYVAEPIEVDGNLQQGVSQVLVIGETAGTDGKFLDVYKDNQLISLPAERVLNMGKAIPLMGRKNKYGGIITADPEGSKRIIVGDSITYFMHEHTEKDKNINSWFAQAAMGGDWMKGIAVPAISSPSVNGKKIIIALGANDLLGTQGNRCWNVDQFIAFYKSAAVRLLINQGAKIYVSAVLPVDSGDVNMNKKIVAFNKKIAANLPADITFLDSHSHLNAVGYDFIDGLHLTPDTSRKLYAYWMKATADDGEQISIPVPTTETVLPVDPQVVKAIEEAKAKEAAEAKAKEVAEAKTKESTEIQVKEVPTTVVTTAPVAPVVASTPETVVTPSQTIKK